MLKSTAVVRSAAKSWLQWRPPRKRAVVLIDEYDKPLLDVLDTGLKATLSNNELLLEEHHRNVLKGFYSVFKAADADLQFVLLTGVTKFSQVSVFSGFNQPEDISMNRNFEALRNSDKVLSL